MLRPIIFKLNRNTRSPSKNHGTLPLILGEGHPLSIGRGGGPIVFTQDLSAASATMDATVAKTGQKPLAGAMATMAGAVSKITKKIFSAS